MVLPVVNLAEVDMVEVIRSAVKVVRLPFVFKVEAHSAWIGL